MSAPLIWIFIPLLLGVSLLLLDGWRHLVAWAATFSALLFSLMAAFIPLGELVVWGPLQFELSDTFNIFGRQVIIDRSDTIILMLVFAGTAFWNGGAYLAGTPRLFPGLSMVSAAFIVMALSVEPFLYGALIIFLVALINLPLLVSPGAKVGKGILRYLVFQTLGMPFILFVGWMLTGLALGASQTDVEFRAFILLGVGFALWLAVFPFHSWVPMLSQEVHPYVSTYLLNTLTMASLLFLYGLIGRYAWLRDSLELLAILRAAGVLMVLVNGVFALAERHQSRLLGYALLLDIGYSLIALGSFDAGYQLFFALFIPRILAFAVWGLALSALNRMEYQVSSTGAGAYRMTPLVALGMLVGLFSTLGFPLMAGFPLKLAVLEALAASDPAALSWVILGVGGLLVAGLRTLIYLVSVKAPASAQTNPQRWLDLAILLGTIMIFLIGSLPGWFLPIYINLLP
jgi:NADH-quinone oxidoreductase subunit N